MPISLKGQHLPTVLSLFSGAGGMDVGLEAAGFDHQGLIEIDPIPRSTIRLNRDWELIGDGDINSVANWLKPEDLGLTTGELSLIAGGPPCQPFSAAAQWARNGRRGLLDERAETILGMLKLVESFLPKAILMENVVGFLQGKNSALAFLTTEIDQIGKANGVTYKQYSRVLNAADYGVAQNRQRAIIVFLRDDVEFEWPEPTHNQFPLTAWDVLHDVAPMEVPSASGKWAGLLPAIPPGENYQWLTARGGGEEVFGYRTRFWNFLLKLTPDAPSWTLSASPGPATGPFHWQNRPLAVEEQLRLQSFPDGWQLAGESRDKTRQIGNATPPLLAEVLGRSVLKALGHPQEGGLKLSRARAGRPTPKPEHLPGLPEEYRQLIGVKSPHAGTGLGPSPVR